MLSQISFESENKIVTTYELEAIKNTKNKKISYLIWRLSNFSEIQLREFI